MLAEIIDKFASAKPVAIYADDCSVEWWTWICKWAYTTKIQQNKENKPTVRKEREQRATQITSIVFESTFSELFKAKEGMCTWIRRRQLSYTQKISISLAEREAGTVLEEKSSIRQIAA